MRLRCFTPIVLALSLAPIACDGSKQPAGEPAKDAAQPTGQTAQEASAASAVDFTPAARVATSSDGTYEVTWEPVGGTIPDAEPFSIGVGVRRIDGAALPASARIRVDAEMPHHGHGMNLVPGVTRRGADAYFVVDSMLFHMTGRWVLAVDVEEDGVSERAQWYVDIE
ncbi:MAG: hypothetical protein LW636_12270 [Planctomycetaceae bacterium]|nr:hypothetical protein [Planctomycetaceae bacterium]